jgi:uncharacterized membrane protein
MRVSRLLQFTAFAVLFLLGRSSVFADSFTLLSVPGSSTTEAWGINNSGTVVGWFRTGSGPQIGFVEQGGVYTPLDPPGSTGSIAYGINNSGTIVGEAFYGSVAEGFILSGGIYTLVSAPGDSNTIFQGINDEGVIVGWGYGPSTTTGLIDDHGTFSSLSCAGFENSVLQGINNSGNIAGLCSNPSSRENFVFDGSTFHVLPPYGDGQVVLGINNSDDVVGYSQVTSGVLQTGFLYNGSTYRNISYSSTQSTIATDLNDENLVVGIVVNSTGEDGFVDKVPEPASLLLLSVGLLAVILQRSRRRRMTSLETGIGCS